MPVIRTLITALFINTICTANVVEAQPAYYIDKVSSTPDLTQTDPRGHFDVGGKNYCAPVSVSNSFVWLSQHGYPKLLPEPNLKQKQAIHTEKTEEPSNRQIELVRVLSSPTYMNTKGEEGTEVDNVLLGIKAYVLDKGYSIKRFEYEGFRSALPEFNRSSRYPRLNSLKSSIVGKSGVWLNIGWYKFNKRTNIYVRIGGHWVTLVGYGVDENNHPANDVFIVHNPAAKSGPSFHNDFLHLEPISGILMSRYSLRGFPRTATGFEKIVSGLPPFTECDTAILEGGVLLELN